LIIASCHPSTILLTIFTTPNTMSSTQKTQKTQQTPQSTTSKKNGNYTP
jgi:hypothetical protein